MKELLIDYIDGRLTGELKLFVEKHINKSSENKQSFEELKVTVELLERDRELTPDSKLKLDFLDTLEEEIDQVEHPVEQKDTRILGIKSSDYWQIAAAIALLAVGLLGGYWIKSNNQNQKEMLAMQEEIDETKKMVMMALENKHSASQRMLGVNASYQLQSVDKEIVDVLVETMNNDENVNVRLAAINALANFKEQSVVRKALITSLGKQTDAIVQITLINLMVEMKERGAMKELEQIINESTNIESVKDEAHMAVFKLS